MRKGCLTVLGVVAVLWLAALFINGPRTTVKEPRVAVTADTVVLDFATGTMTIGAWVPRAAADSAGKAFVWAFFTHPSQTGSWSDMPIRVRADFAGKDSVHVRAVLTGFHWATNSGVPKSGYSAVVFAGPDSASLPQPSAERDRRSSRGVPVAAKP